MDYICLKPCRFSDVEYRPGDAVPENMVLPQRVGALIRAHIIGAQTISIAAQTGEDMDNDICIPISSNNGAVTIAVTADDVQQVMSILQLPEEQAVTEVASLKKEDALVMLAVIDMRPGIRAAIQPRVSKIDIELPKEKEVATTAAKTGKKKGET